MCATAHVDNVPMTLPESRQHAGAGATRRGERKACRRKLPAVAGRIGRSATTLNKRAGHVLKPVHDTAGFHAAAGGRRLRAAGGGYQRARAQASKCRRRTGVERVA